MLDNYECYYCCKTPRIDLGDGKTEVARDPWAGKTNGFTLLFGALIDQLCLLAPVNSVAKKYKELGTKLFYFISIIQKHLHRFLAIWMNDHTLNQAWSYCGEPTSQLQRAGPRS